MDTAQSHRQGVDRSMRTEPRVESRMKPHKEQALNCPRCTSTNTKFCYYNNYSLSQPRYFCKTCKRYWTEGGFLRNVPVGGGSRRNNKRSFSSTTKLAPSASSSMLHVQHCPEFKMTLSKNSANVRTASCTQQLSVVSSYESTIPFGTYKGGQVLNLSSTNQISALGLLRSEISARMLDPFVAPVSMSMPSAAAAYGDGFGLQELKISSNLKLPWDEVGGGGYGGNMQDVEGGGGGGFLFPFEDLKQLPINNDSGVVMENGTETTLFWNGVMDRDGGGGRGGGGEGSW